MKVTVRGVEHSLERPRELGRSFRGEGVWSLEIDGRTRQVEVIAAGADQLDLVIDGQRVVLATARAAGGAVLVSHRGRTRRVEPVLERRRRGGGAEVATRVTPSFPATVVSVLVEEGEQVERGQALVVVSAMKMEMTLTAPTAGVVEAVNTAEGAAVSPGDELVVVAAAAEEEGRDDRSD